MTRIRAEVVVGQLMRRASTDLMMSLVEAWGTPPLAEELACCADFRLAATC